MWFARPGQRRESAVSITGTLGQRQRRFQSGRVSGLATRSPLSPTLWWVLHSRWMPVDRPSVVVVACTARISYRKPRPVWTFDERQRFFGGTTLTQERNFLMLRYRYCDVAHLCYLYLRQRANSRTARPATSQIDGSGTNVAVAPRKAPESEARSLGQRLDVGKPPDGERWLPILTDN